MSHGRLLFCLTFYMSHSFFIVEADGEIPEELVGCAKILMMPLDEFKDTVLEGKKLPSTKLTIEVQKVLRELLESRLTAYTSDSKVCFFSPILVESISCLYFITTDVIKLCLTFPILQDDRAFLKQTPPEAPRNKRNAVIVRTGEREILQSMLDKVKKWRPPPPPAANGKQKGNAKGQPPNKGKKPYQKK